MNSDPSPARRTIQSTDQALSRGDRLAAQAVALTPNLKETRRRTGIKKQAPHWTVVWATILLLTLAGAAIWSGVSSAQGVPAPTSSREAQSWSQVQMAKPTYTPSPVPTVTATAMPTPTPIPTEMPEMGAPATGPENEAEVYAQGAIYVVQRGDTLGQIAARFGVSLATLSEANHLPDPSSIYAGQELVIPGVDFIPPQPRWTGGPKRILVDISEQQLYAYEGDDLVYRFLASTGMNNATAIGTFSVLSKIPNAYGSTWNIWMPYWLGIYWSGGLENGIHALPILPGGSRLWSGYLGTPISYGCVVLGEYEARLLYEWAEIGTPVVIQW